MIKLSEQQREARRIASKKYYDRNREVILAIRQQERHAKRPTYLKNKIASLRNELKQFVGVSSKV